MKKKNLLTIVFLVVTTCFYGQKYITKTGSVKFEATVPSFEEVAADIFDHLLAAVPYFDLEIFQSPSGSDMRGFVGRGND